MRKAKSWESQSSTPRFAEDGWNYPTGMVWCPMKMSGMALMKCAELQKELGCGSLRQLWTLRSRKPGNPLVWPWLRRGRQCPERASEEEVRALRLALSPLRLVEKSRKNPRAYRCAACGGPKSFGSRRCRDCWRVSVSRSQGPRL